MKYILSGNIQSDPLEKRFGRYWQLRGANYFGSQKQFLEAEKAIRVKSLIKFSNYSMKEICQIMGKDEKKIESEVEIYSEMLVDMMCSKENAAYLSGIDKNVIYYVAGFIARSVKKSIKCKDCGNVLGNNTEIRMILDGIATEDCQYFLDLV